jgi:C-terminal processing protease CtpA/Prc
MRIAGTTPEQSMQKLVWSETNVAEDTRIGYADWVRKNREYVDKKSNGQIGYIHLNDMSNRGLRQCARDYPSQWRKRGLTMDDRWNHGGFVAPMILAHLDRKIHGERRAAAFDLRMRINS